MTLKITVKGQELTLLDNNQLSIVQNKTKPLDNWILDTFFPNKVGFDNQKAVPIDELETSQPLAPFVSPVVQGKPIREQGNFERKYIQAPYVKPAKMITPANTYDLALFTRLKDATIIKGDMSMSDKWWHGGRGAFYLNLGQCGWAWRDNHSSECGGGDLKGVDFCKQMVYIIHFGLTLE